MLLQVLDVLDRPGGQIVERQYVMPVSQQTLCEMGADEARPPCDECFHAARS